MEHKVNYHVCDCGYVIQDSLSELVEAEFVEKERAGYHLDWVKDRTSEVCVELAQQQAKKLLDMIAEWESEYSWGSDEEAATITQAVKGAVKNKERETK